VSNADSNFDLEIKSIQQ